MISVIGKKREFERENVTINFRIHKNIFSFTKGQTSLSLTSTCTKPKMLLEYLFRFKMFTSCLWFNRVFVSLYM